MIRAAVLGGDVRQSRSPAIHEAAYSALGLPGRYDNLSVDAAGFRPLVRRLAADGLLYVNVTIPHKRAAAALAGSASPLVRATGAANTLVFRRRGIRAENTDGHGLLAALADLGARVRRGTVVVLVGSGGAAAGALAALLDAGATVRLVARRPAAARALGRRLTPRRRARLSAFPWTAAGLEGALRDADVMVSAVPAAAWEPATARAGLDAVNRRCAILDMAYGRAPSPLAALARRRKLRFQDGIPMLVHQAARAIELALGRRPPVAPLLAAARG